MACFADEFRSVLKRLRRGHSPSERWVAGCYYISALVRLPALLDRRDVPLTEASRSRLIHDIDWFKHRDEAHPVRRIDGLKRLSAAN